MADTILTLDCWHPGCAFHELLEGIEVHDLKTDKVKLGFFSDVGLWERHNQTHL